MLSRMRVSCLAVLVIGSVAMAGCSNAEAPGASGELSLGPFEQVSSPEQVNRPIDAYVLTADRSVELVDAERRLISSCLSRLDPAFVATAWSAPGDEQMRAYFRSLVSDDVLRSDLWGFFDPSQALISGYERADAGPAVLDMPMPPASEQDVTACIGEARDRLPGAAGAIGLVGLNALPDGGPPVPVTDSRFAAVVSEWSACMRASGYDYHGPLDAIAALASRGDADRQASIAVASNDVRCKIETNLVGIGVAVQSAYDQEYIDRHRDALDRRQAAIEAFLRAAASSR